jgi:transglutaminase-like putative cysteine protease
MNLAMLRTVLALGVAFSALAVAEESAFAPLVGKEWYGLYLQGKKAGYAFEEVAAGPGGSYVVVEDAHFRITMAGEKQDLRAYSKRTYGADGALQSIESQVVDPKNTSDFNATVSGETMTLVSRVSGETKTSTISKPAESLKDALKAALWVKSAPAIGDTLTYSTFEPMYEKELVADCTVMAIEERPLEGVPTKVYKIETKVPLMGVDSISYVAQDGTILEDVVAGIITMRLEPETVAKDVSYENDVIVSNAAVVNAPIPNPRERTSLRLNLRGPLEPDNLYNDERQFIESSGGGFNFVANQVSLEGFTPAAIPVANEDVQPWLKSTTFIQSDNEKLKAKAKEILKGETNALEASRKLCNWVFANMRSTFSARLSNALEVLEHLEGDCTEHSTLFLGLARAAGLPARECAGLIYVDGPPPGFYFHQWAKVWIGKWIDVDPTFNQPLADVTHIKLVEGDLFEQSRIIPMIGNIKIEVLPDAASAAAN